MSHEPRATSHPFTGHGSPVTGHGSRVTRRWFAAALLIYCAIALSLTGPALIGRSSILPEGFIDRDLLYRPGGERAHLRPWGDATPIYLELGRERAFAAGLQRGRIDTWNPWSSAGAPLWAEQGSPFFPTKWIYYLYPHHATLMAALAARLVVAALGMFFLARALGLAPPLALFTGAVLEYSGMLAEQLAFGGNSAMYMLPWVLLGAHKLAAGGGPGAVAVSALALGIASLSGHPAYVLLVYLGFGAWLAGALAQRRAPAQAARAAGLAVASGALAVVIAAVALLPFLELLWHGSSYKDARLGEESWAERLDWTRDAFAAALLVPSLMSAVRDTILFHYWPYAAGASIGFAALLLAAAGAARLREHWGAIVMAGLGVGLTLAPAGLQWLHGLPGVRYILPWYCYPLIVVPLCLAAGLGLQSLAAAPRKYLLVLPFGALFCGLLLVLAALLGAFELLLPVKAALADSGLYRKILRGDIRHLADWRVLISPVAGIVAVLAYVLLCRVGAARAAVAIAVIALVEAAALRIPTGNFERSFVLQSAPAPVVTQLRTLLSADSWRFIAWPHAALGVPNTSMLFELRDFRGNAALVVRRLATFLDLAGAQPRATAQAPATIELPMLGLAAVKYVFSVERNEFVVVENAFALPRARIARDIVAVEGERAAYEALRGALGVLPSEVPPAWPRRAVIEGVAPDEAAGVRATSGSPGPESVRIVSEPDPQTIVLEANLDAPGYVVVADTYYPGWTATVDGAPTAIRPADLMFRAVHVPAGKHTIVMTYASSWLRIGAALTLLGLVLAAALLARERALNRHARARP